MDKSCRENIILSSGAIITHKRMKNGAQEAIVSNRKTGTMTDNEWEEYCQIIVNKNKRQ